MAYDTLVRIVFCIFVLMGHLPELSQNKTSLDETSQDKTRQTEQVDCCMINRQCITIKMGHITNITIKNSVLHFCFVASSGY
jgi:hypothetical protein